MNTSSGYYCHGVTEALGLGISCWGFFYARTLKTNDATSAIKGSCKEFIIRALQTATWGGGGGPITSNGERPTYFQWEFISDSFNKQSFRKKRSGVRNLENTSNPQITWIAIRFLSTKTSIKGNNPNRHPRG